MILFNLTQTQKEICKAADDFARGEFAPDLARDLDRNCKFPSSIWQKAADLGFVGLHYAESYGGGGLGMLETVLVAEVFGRRDPSLGMAMVLPALSVEYIAGSVNTSLKEHYLPQITQGRCLTGISLDDVMPFAETTQEKGGLSCEVAGEAFVVRGVKQMVLNAACANALVVKVKRPADDTVHEQFDILLAVTELPGIRVRAAEETLGLRAIEISEVVFDHVSIPKSHHLATIKTGTGSSEKIASANWLLLAGIALGLGQGALDRSIGYIKQRCQFGRRLGSFQVVRHKLARVAAALNQARSLTYMAADHWQHQKFSAAEAAMAKWAGGEAALAAAYEAIQLHGGYGYMTEYDVERYYREAKAITLVCGSSSLLQDKIAAALIGKVK